MFSITFMLLIALVSVSADQRLISGPTNQTVLPGSYVELVCLVDQIQGQCSWNKNGVVQRVAYGKYIYNSQPRDGICSLAIYNASLEHDDGTWQCQVSKSTLHGLTLRSTKAHLAIIVAAPPPCIVFNSKKLDNNSSVDVTNGTTYLFECSVAEANPAAVITWKIDENVFTDQYNVLVEDGKLHVTTDQIYVRVSKGFHGKHLVCQAEHPSFSQGIATSTVTLNVLYAPKASVDDGDIGDIELGTSLKADCVVDSNPPSTAIWYKTNEDGILENVTTDNTLSFNEIQMNDSATYTCAANNSLGWDYIRYHLQVKCPPKQLKVNQSTSDVMINGNFKLNCSAFGNPQVTYKWIHHMLSGLTRVISKSGHCTVEVNNYEQGQGYYECVAENIINNQTRRIRSSKIYVNITGRPLISVMSAVNQHSVSYISGENASVCVVFCSNPRNFDTVWKKDNHTCNVNDSRINISLNNDQGNSCYKSVFELKNVSEADEGIYKITVSNDYGQDSFEVNLKIKKTLETQSIMINPHHKLLNPGDSAILTCAVKNIEGQCVWVMDGDVMTEITDKYSYSGQPADGDCSLHVHDADILHDDGYWQCQVSSPNLNETPLTSAKAKLTVIQKPHVSLLGDSNLNALDFGSSLIVQESTMLKLYCFSYQGNPPASIQWVLGNKMVSPSNFINNVSENNLQPKTWDVLSLFFDTLSKEDNGKNLTCVTHHEGFDGIKSSRSVRLNVTYYPILHFTRRPTDEIVEGSELFIGIGADANPPAQVMWVKYDESGVRGPLNYDTNLYFPSVNRYDSGTYSFHAKNALGWAQALIFSFSVKYPARILSVSSSNEPNIVRIGDDLQLVCKAEGFPTPQYTWTQVVEIDENDTRLVTRSEEPAIRIYVSSYDYEGTYICAAKNTVNGTVKEDHRELNIDIKGPPLVMTEFSSSSPKMIKVGPATSLVITFCADPADPDQISWTHNGTVINFDSANTLHTFTVLKRPDCYESRIDIDDVTLHQGGSYNFYVINEYGSTSHQIDVNLEGIPS